MLFQGPNVHCITSSACCQILSACQASIRNLVHDRSLCNTNIHTTNTDDIFATSTCFVQTVCKGLVHIRLQPRALFHLNRDSNAQYRALHGQVWNVCCFKVPTCTVSQAALAARSHHPVKQAYESWDITFQLLSPTEIVCPHTT